MKNKTLIKKIKKFLDDFENSYEEDWFEWVQDANELLLKSHKALKEVERERSITEDDCGVPFSITNPVYYRIERAGKKIKIFYDVEEMEKEFQGAIKKLPKYNYKA